MLIQVPPAKLTNRPPARSLPGSLACLLPSLIFSQLAHASSIRSEWLRDSTPWIRKNSFQTPALHNCCNTISKSSDVLVPKSFDGIESPAYRSTPPSEVRFLEQKCRLRPAHRSLTSGRNPSGKTGHFSDNISGINTGAQGERWVGRKRDAFRSIPRVVESIEES